MLTYRKNMSTLPLFLRRLGTPLTFALPLYPKPPPSPSSMVNPSSLHPSVLSIRELHPVPLICTALHYSPCRLYDFHSKQYPAMASPTTIILYPSQQRQLLSHSARTMEDTRTELEKPNTNRCWCSVPCWRRYVCRIEEGQQTYRRDSRVVTDPTTSLPIASSSTTNLVCSASFLVCMVVYDGIVSPGKYELWAVKPGEGIGRILWISRSEHPSVFTWQRPLETRRTSCFMYPMGFKQEGGDSDDHCGRMWLWDFLSSLVKCVV